MRVGIIGGGSIGLLFTAYFQTNTHDVTLYVRREEQYKRLLNEGLTFESAGSTTICAPKVKVLESVTAESLDLLVVAVKSYDLERLLPIIKSRFVETRFLLLLQNGMDHTQWLSDLSMFSLYLGVVEHGALRKSDVKVVHTGVGRTKIAPYLDGGTGLDWTKLSFDRFPFQQVGDWYSMLSQKLLINAVINPLTALLQVPNGELLEREQWMKLMETMYKELCTIIEVEDKETAWQDVINVCKNTAENKSSMLRDIENGNKTEIEAINGFALKIAQQQSKDLPYNRFVYNAIKGLEERAKGRG